MLHTYRRFLLAEQRAGALTLYHGSPKPFAEKTDYLEWYASASPEFAARYGALVYALDVRPGLLFDSTDPGSIAALYDAGYAVQDPHTGEDYATPDDYLDALDPDNTWHPIEASEEAFEWLKLHYDLIKIREDGYTNYVLHRRVIRGARLL